MSKEAVLLLSGGADSATVGAVAKRDGFDLFAMTLDYGQRHRIELEMAEKTAKALNVKKHLVLKLDLRAIGASALTSDIKLPLGRTMEEMSTGIPVTYVPARNTIFLSLALGWAESLGTGDIFIGVNALDYSGYPDCRKEYIDAFEKMARLATKMGVENEHNLKIHTPLIDMTKAQIFKLGTELGVDFSLTHSCYDPGPDGISCGRCDSCLLRLKGFSDANLEDPIKYRNSSL